MTATARQAGFTSLAPFADAVAWVGGHAGRLDAEAVPAQDACGRVLAVPLTTAAMWPDMDRAAIDGWAVSARETEGASDYNSLPLDVAIPVLSGTAIPHNTDAVAAPHTIGSNGPVRHALATVARGAGIERAGSDAPAGFEVPAGVLRPKAVAMLGLLGVASVAAIRRPRVGLVVAGPKSGPDVLTPMLCALIAGDGGVGLQSSDLPLLLGHRPDLMVLVGRAGLGRDDNMVARLSDAGGTLDLHGIAVRPGRSAGLGTCHGVPVLVLPGTPNAALAAYELLAGPCIRRMGGLGRAVLSDGWVVVPDGHEGYPAGAAVTVHLPGRADA